MANDQRSPQPDFVRLDGHAVRVTSWCEADERQAWTMVTVVRGSRDAGLLDDLLARDELNLELEGRPALAVSARDIERREFGSGQSAITRFSVTFAAVPVQTTAPASEAPSIEDRVTALEAEVQRLNALLRLDDRPSKP